MKNKVNPQKILSLLALSLFTACQTDLTDHEGNIVNETSLHEDALNNFEALPETDIDQDKFKARIELGRSLYFEKSLSINGKISCNSCHGLDSFGVDNEATSPGHDGTRGDRNSPTVYNASLHFAQFWDGRAKDVEEQAIGPILNPIEHGLASESDALKKINTPRYQALFKKAFADDKTPFSYKNIGRAIGAFERTLLTQSRFDDYLRGHKNALSRKEKRGLTKFISVGCIGCHAGSSIGGTSFETLGLVNEFKTKDLGRFVVTKEEEDKFKFKVPGLRNVTKTHPYFHDGSVSELSEAVRLMAYHQLDLKLKDKDVSDIVAFLGSLTAKRLPKFSEIEQSLAQ